MHLAGRLLSFAAACCVALPLAAQSNLPRSWVDKDTGHRVFRLTDEPGSSGFYFNVNAYSPDGKLMAYSAPDGIHVLELATRKTRLLVPNPPRPAGEQVAGRGYFRGGVHAVSVFRVFFLAAGRAVAAAALPDLPLAGFAASAFFFAPAAAAAGLPADFLAGRFAVFFTTAAGAMAGVAAAGCSAAVAARTGAPMTPRAIQRCTCGTSSSSQ